MANRKIIIKHNVLKKPDGVAPFQLAWNDEDHRTFPVYKAEMEAIYPGGFTEMPEEDSPYESERKKIRTLLQAVPAGPIREGLRDLYKRIRTINEND